MIKVPRAECVLLMSGTPGTPSPIQGEHPAPLPEARAASPHLPVLGVKRYGSVALSEGRSRRALEDPQRARLACVARARWACRAQRLGWRIFAVREDDGDAQDEDILAELSDDTEVRPEPLAFNWNADFSYSRKLI